MTIIKLPGLWFDNLATLSTAGLYIANEYPEPGDADVSTTANVIFELLSTHVSGVDLAATDVYIDGVAAMLGGVFQAGYSTGSSATPINVHDLRIEIAEHPAWASEATVSVRVISQTLDAAFAIDTTYTFDVEDVVAPRLLSAAATYADRVRVTFDEGMLSSSSSGAADALNPANYSVEYVQTNPLEAAVSAAVSSVSKVSATVFELTVDIPLTFRRTYKVVAGAIADDSNNANPLDASFREASFASWFPPSWPENRRFSFWDDMIADDDREGDSQGDLARFLSVLQDTLDVRLWDLDRFYEVWDIDRAPEVFILAMLQDLGNPFGIATTLNKKRKLLDLLIAAYKQKGTAIAIVNLCRFFLGLEVTVTAHNDNAEVWILEGEPTLDVSGLEGGLGVDTVIGPGPGTRELYTFIVQSAIVLSAQQRIDIAHIVERVKVAHEHYLIIDPSDAPEYDPWELNLSYLGEDTFLHE